MTTITIEDYHEKYASQATRVIPVGGKTQGPAGSWDIRCPEWTKVGNFIPTDRASGQYCELHPCNATINGQEFENAVFRDGLPFAGILPALLVMG